MKLSTLLLSSAAILVAGSAYAADLPAKKGAPAKAATGCPAFGAGFFQIPGGDTCLKIGGYVRSNNSMKLDSQARGTPAYSLAAAYDLSFDARSNTDIGTLKSYISIYNTGTEYAYVNVAGLTAGSFGSITDLGVYGINSGSASGLTDTGLLYQQAIGSSTLSVAAVSAVTTAGSTGTASNRPDLMLGVTTSAGPATLKLVAVSHEAVGTTSGSANGYAFVGNASMTAGAATFAVHGASASGASAYTTGATLATTTKDVDATSASLSTSNMLGASAALAVGTGTLKVYGNQSNVNGASGSTTSYKNSTYGAQYAIAVAKGLTVTPEFYTNALDTGTGSATSNNVYLRIQRDF